MGNLKRNAIELVTKLNDQGEVAETEVYWTPAFIPFDVVYQAVDLSTEMKEKNNEREMMDRFVDFVTNDIYKNQFTKEDLKKGLHAPNAIETLQQQIMFVAQGAQSSETKKFLEKKR